MSRRLALFVSVFITTAGALSVRARMAPPEAETFVAAISPQRAVADLDGDGRSDLATISRRFSASQISLQLSASHEIVELDGPVSGLVSGDIDDDGDVDLVAATPSGDVKVFLNDGRGRFTRKDFHSPQRSLAGLPSVAGTSPEQRLVLSTTLSLLHPPLARAAVVLNARVRPPTRAPVIASFRTAPRSLRAPPSPVRFL